MTKFDATMRKLTLRLTRWFLSGLSVSGLSAAAGLALVGVTLVNPLMSGQERGNRTTGNKAKTSNAVKKKMAKAGQVVDSFQESLTFQGNAAAVNSVAFSPDGERLASAGGTGGKRGVGELKVWDSRRVQEIFDLKGHTEWVSSVAYSPDGKRLASASEDRTVKIWDATNGQETLTLKHAQSVHSVAFSPDGKRLASASGIFDKPGEVKVWDATSGQDMQGQRPLTLFAG